jgi:hypothetical protein
MFTDKLIEDIFDWFLGTYFTDVEIGLSTTTPNQNGTNITEPIGNAYSRVSVADWTVRGDYIDNDSRIDFPQAFGGTWGTVSHWVLYNNGSPRIFGEIVNDSGIATPVLINDEDFFSFESRGIVIEIVPK